MVVQYQPATGRTDRGGWQRGFDDFGSVYRARDKKDKELTASKDPHDGLQGGRQAGLRAGSRTAAQALVAAVRRLSRREGLFPSGCRALVMVSGGQDSVALLHLLATGSLGKAGPGTLHVLHINHHLRGEESDADQALVERVCERLGVALTVLHRPVAKRGNVQEVAREARRKAAWATAEDQGASRIVLGHTADDQVETMLYRLGRYGGLAAFRGMLPCDPPWVRPLLACRRVETAAYCQALGLEYADDRGNRYPGYARTALREQVLPAWETAVPGAVRGAGRAAEVAAEIERLTRRLVAECWDEVRAEEASLRSGQASLQGGLHEAGTEGEEALTGPDVLRVSALVDLETSLRRLVLHAWLEGRARPAASRASVLAVEELLSVSGSASRHLGGGWQARKVYDYLWLEPRGGVVLNTTKVGRTRVATGEVAPNPEVPAGRAAVPVLASEAAQGETESPALLPIPGSVVWAGRRLTASVLSGVPRDRYQQPDLAREAFVDARCLTGEVVVRGPRPGDRIRPLGAPGFRKLQDVLVDLKVPREARKRLPLVVADGKIIWVCGLVVAEEGRITGDTEKIVWLQVSEGGLMNGVT